MVSQLPLAVQLDAHAESERCHHSCADGLGRDFAHQHVDGIGLSWPH